MEIAFEFFFITLLCAQSESQPFFANWAKLCSVENSARQRLVGSGWAHQGRGVEGNLVGWVGCGMFSYPAYNTWAHPFEDALEKLPRCSNFEWQIINFLATCFVTWKKEKRNHHIKKSSARIVLPALMYDMPPPPVPRDIYSLNWPWAFTTLTPLTCSPRDLLPYLLIDHEPTEM